MWAGGLTRAAGSAPCAARRRPWGAGGLRLGRRTGIAPADNLNRHDILSVYGLRLPISRHRLPIGRPIGNRRPSIGNRSPKNSNLTVRLAIARRRLAFSRRRLPISPRQPGFARHMVPIHGGQWGSAARRRRWANPASAETRSFAMPPARRPSRNCQPRTAGGAAPHGWQASSISNGIFIVESQACMIEHVAPHPSDSLFSFGNAHVQLRPQTHLHHRAPRR